MDCRLAYGLRLLATSAVSLCKLAHRGTHLQHRYWGIVDYLLIKEVEQQLAASDYRKYLWFEYTNVLGP